MRPPDKEGIARAWRFRHTPEAELAHHAEHGHISAGLATWIINGPYHPFWSWWLVGVVHLRELPNAGPPVIVVPGATHEMVCYTLDPDPPAGRPAVPDLDRCEAGDLHGGLPGLLHPADWVVQFTVPEDRVAVHIAELAVDAIVAGDSCDSDYRGAWERTITQTAAHYNEGRHTLETEGD